ncbi:MAG: exodeoxyribonuclease VII large subunit, partial [Deltaproteobacteria bacterium]
AARARAAALRDRLDRAMRALLAARRDRAALARRTLTVLSPTASLERGYAIVRRPDGLVVRDARQVDIGASVEVILHAGALEATVAQRSERNVYEPEEP